METIQNFASNIPANIGNIFDSVRNMDSAQLARVGGIAAGAVAVTVGLVALAVFLGKKNHADNINKQLSPLCANVTVNQVGAQETHFNYYQTQLDLTAMVAAVKAASAKNREVFLNYNGKKFEVGLEKKRYRTDASFNFDAKENKIKVECQSNQAIIPRLNELTARLNETMQGDDSQ